MQIGDNLHEMSNPVLETICMKYQILFSGENKKNKITNLSSAELAQRVVKVKITTGISNNNSCKTKSHFA